MKNLFSKAIPAFLFLACTVNPLRAQIAFVSANDRFTGNATHSGCSMTITDWNGDGLDDIIRLDMGRTVIVEVQRTNQTFYKIQLGQFAQNSGWAWGMAAADFDHNGYKDIIAGGNNTGVKILMTNNDGTGGTIVTIPNSQFFVQNITIADFNNDGWLDAFVCDDNAPSHIFANDGSGTLVASNIINFALNPTITYGNDPADSGNYGSAWTDFDNDGDLDLYVAHCRQSTNNPSDLRRINRLFQNNGDGTFTENAAAYNIAVGWQTWTSSFGDIDNDGDFDLLLTNHDYASMIMLNDGSGHYTDITPSTNVNLTTMTPIESFMEDFDNDGFLDLIVSGSAGRIYRNNGNNTFTSVQGAFIDSNMLSFATGDINHDGFIDIYGSYGNIYTTPTNDDDILYLNNGNSNHFFSLNLRGTTSNHDAIGAKALIYGSWGVQIREVRSGESYGTTNSPILHFGLGQSTAIDSLVIHWPSGSAETIYNVSADQFMTVIENNCISPEALLSSNDSDNILCPGDSLVLSVPAGYNYLWSDSTTAASLVVHQAGEYNVRVSAPNNACVAISRTIRVQMNPDETPVIAALGAVNFCQGESVTLTAPSGLNGYSWSNGILGQQTTVNQSGNYTLTIQGTCQAYTSAPIEVTVYQVPTPSNETLNINMPGSYSLNSSANADSLVWYDAATGGNILGYGNNFNALVGGDTTFYMEAVNQYGGGVFNTGKTNVTAQATNLYGGNTTNGALNFTVNAPCILRKVKTYTDRPGTRDIEVKDLSGNLVTHLLVNIPIDTNYIDLNFVLAPGDYTIGTNGTVNQQIPNNQNLVNPRLRRANQQVSYPYALDSTLVISGSSLGQNVYYYFFDWKVEKQADYCSSTERGEFHVMLDPLGIHQAEKSIAIYPNPSQGNITVTSDSKTIMEMFDAAGRLVYTQSLLPGNTQVSTGIATPGVYQLRFSDGNNLIRYKLIIQ